MAKQNKLVANVADDKVFWVHDGPVLKSVKELYDYLPSMSDDIFNYHVNGERNDFSNWIKDVVGDKQLANDICKCKNRNSAIRKLKVKIGSTKKAS